jgi:hypothetical protein
MFRERVGWLGRICLYAGDDNHLVPNQNLLILALIWAMDYTPAE